MKKILMSISLGLMISASVSAQGFGIESADFTPFQGQDKGNDFIECGNSKTPKTGDAYFALYCTRKNGIESVMHKSTGVPAGLYGKVSSAANAQRPRQTQRSVGSYNYQTSDAHLQWVADRNARLVEQRRRDEERRRQEALARKIADDNRAAAVTAATNARLQGETDRAINRDRWHANEGAAQAQQRGRAAHKLQGPQIAGRTAKPTNSQNARMLRGGNKLRVKSGSTAPRRQLTAVRRTATPDPRQQAAQQQAMQRKAEYVARQRQLARERNEAMQRAAKAKQAEIERKYQEDRQIVAGGKSNTRFNLSSNATSSLGKDWKTVSLTTPPIPPRRKMTEDDWHRLKVIEFIDQRPLTPEEKAYFNSLTI